MRFKRQQRDKLSVDITPLIDVVFLLLIFFMVSTSFSKKTELTIDLPEATGQMQLQQPGTIEVVVTQEGEYSVNGKNLVNKELITLKNAISILSNANKKIRFIITADSQAPYQSVVRVMDVAGQLGLNNLSITTVRPEENKE